MDKVVRGSIHNCVFQRNKAVKGGAFSNVNPGILVTVKTCEFNGNRADIGGAISSTDMRSWENQELELGTIILDECLMKENRAKVMGQSIFNNNNIRMSKVCDLYDRLIILRG